ncbi:pyruvate dehydrogenase, partial [Mycobacterium tuberculosis]|nr:pyruvate dehydrogenase [Mycobacterium tuberculosis]
LETVFAGEGGEALRQRLVSMPNPEYQRLLRAHPTEVHDRLLAGLAEADAASLRTVTDRFAPDDLASLIRDLGGHDLGQLVDTFDQIDDT